jgi:tRNA1(Val) A37 N6-methylase TrmN6
MPSKSKAIPIPASASYTTTRDGRRDAAPALSTGIYSTPSSKTMLALHHTPEDIATVLARWVPRKARRVLDPSVGSGALLKPVLRKLYRPKEIVAVDIDKNAIKELRSRRLICSSKLTTIARDFLSPSVHSRLASGELFDLVVVNPPFHARRSGLRLVLEPSSNRRCRERRVPIECAFLLKAANLVRTGGRLLAILPFSAIAATSTDFVRRHLFQIGWILKVHELPRFSFPGVEAQIYLVLFVKGATPRRLTLLNHRLHQPDQLSLSPTAIQSGKRLDFGFHDAEGRLTRLRATYRRCDWRRVSECVHIARGDAESPKQKRGALHTCDRVDGYYRARPAHASKSNRRKTVRRGDLVISRIGRHCSTSAGIARGTLPSRFSDCLFRLRPLQPKMKTEILFALRVLMTVPQMAAYMERGAGAKYLTEKDLAQLSIPIGLSRRFRRSFASYRIAVTRSDFPLMCRIEKSVSSEMISLAKLSPHNQAR